MNNCGTVTSAQIASQAPKISAKSAAKPQTKPVPKPALKPGMKRKRAEVKDRGGEGKDQAHASSGVRFISYFIVIFIISHVQALQGLYFVALNSVFSSICI
jgi:hypothetical protein